MLVQFLENFQILLVPQMIDCSRFHMLTHTNLIRMLVHFLFYRVTERCATVEYFLTWASRSCTFFVCENQENE